MKTLALSKGNVLFSPFLLFLTHLMHHPSKVTTREEVEGWRKLKPVFHIFYVSLKLKEREFIHENSVHADMKRRRKLKDIITVSHKIIFITLRTESSFISLIRVVSMRC